jgi:hypothetical protein
MDGGKKGTVTMFGLAPDLLAAGCSIKLPASSFAGFRVAPPTGWGVCHASSLEQVSQLQIKAVASPGFEPAGASRVAPNSESRYCSLLPASGSLIARKSPGFLPSSFHGWKSIFA